MGPQKPIHSLIVDTGPLIKNAIEISTLVQQAEELYTIPAILSEIRDAATRSRVQTSLLPFLKIRTPTPASYEVIVNFSKKTGDYPVLSKPDLQLLALAYELECERLGGNWRLRSTPGQKGLNGAPPKKEKAPKAQTDSPAAVNSTTEDVAKSEQKPSEEKAVKGASSSEPAPEGDKINEGPQPEATPEVKEEEQIESRTKASETLEAKLSELNVSLPEEQSASAPEPEEPAQPIHEPVESSLPEVEADLQAEGSASDDSDGEWITPSNLKKHQEKDSGLTPSTQETEAKQMAVATMTTDFAMQNVLLQMNLNLISTNMQRVKQLRTYILRCHACFLTTKQMDKQFCPRCGQATLNRVGCSTSANGEFKLHLAKNFQWNKRGNKFSVPKPVAGAANPKKVQGGGKGGWGNELILAEDQKEYSRTIAEQKRMKTKDLMDEDYLPGILTGDRGRAGGRPKVGAGRNVNSRKRN